MIRSRFLRFSILLAFIAVSVLRGYGADMIYATPIEEKMPVLKGNALLESKGVIVPAVEIGNGGSFQQSIHPVKKFGGNAFSLPVKLKCSSLFGSGTNSLLSEFLSVPRYLFNRSILI